MNEGAQLLQETQPAVELSEIHCYEVGYACAAMWGMQGCWAHLALTLIWLHRGEKRANRQADIHGKLSTEKRTQDKLCHAVSMLPSLRGLPVLHKAEESCPCEWLHPSAVEGRAVTQGCLCVCAVFSWHPALPPPLCLADLTCSCGWGRREMCLCNTW